jgi:hypothetical protein
MSKKNHFPAPIPPGNRPQAGPNHDEPIPDETAPNADAGSAFEEQDPKRRLGGYQTAGEHSRQQPGPLNDG